MRLFDYNKEPKVELTKTTAKRNGMRLFFGVLYDGFWKIVRLNLIFLLFCIPILTIPAAVTAVSKVNSKLLLEEPVFVFTDFYTVFKREFFKSLVSGMAFFVIYAVIFLLINYYSSVGMGLTDFALIFIIIIGGFIFSVFIYLFTSIALLDIKMKNAVKNSLYLTILRLPQNALTVIISAILVLMMWFSVPISLILVVLIMPALVNYICTYCALNGLKKYVIKENMNENPTETR